MSEWISVPNTVCDNCAAAFYKKPAEMSRTNHNFCNKKCAGKFRQKESEKAFLGKAHINERTGCQEWKGYKNKDGYGLLRYKGKVRGAHRVSLCLAQKLDIDSDLLVLHKCDNPSCANPEHLFVGTHADNMKDMHQKMRCAHKLSPQQVNAIRKSLQNSSLLAAGYGVSIRTINYVRERKGGVYAHYPHWMPLPEPPEV